MFGSLASSTSSAATTTSAAPTLTLTTSSGIGSFGGGLGGGLGTLTSGTASAQQSATATTTTAQQPLGPGLGGILQKGTSLGGSGLAGGVAGQSADKENAKEGEVPKEIAQLLPLIEAKLKSNKTLSDELAAASSDSAFRVKDHLKELHPDLRELFARSAAADSQAAALLGRVQHDGRMGYVAATVNEATSKAQYQSAQRQTIDHILSLIEEYDGMVGRCQTVLAGLEAKIDGALSGKPACSVAQLKEYLVKFDALFSAVATKVFEANQQVEELKAQLPSEAFPRTRPAANLYADIPSLADIKGRDAFPSQAVISVLGSQLRTTQPGLPGSTTGVLGTTTVPFGSSTGTGLFGSSTSQPASKPFSFPSTFSTGATSSSGGLFSSLNPATSSAIAPTSSTSGSLFSSLATSKPSTAAATGGFASTISNNSSGLLFSSKK